MRDIFGQDYLPPDDGRSVGCSVCPANFVPGVVKIKGLDRIKKRKGFLWAQTPGKVENEKKLELVGPSGQLVWDEFQPHGITRNDVDVQNVMRCRPLDTTGIEHPPTKRELRCCSVFNEEALVLNDQHAVVHLIFGEVAGKQLLPKQYRKDKPFLWYPPWNAYVIFAPHPSYILRQQGVQHNTWAYLDFKERIKATVACMKYPGRWGYVKSLNSGAIQTVKEAKQLHSILKAEAAAGRRVSVDIENGVVNGKPVILMVGFGWGEQTSDNWDGWHGKARSVVLDHPQAKHPEQRDVIWAEVKDILEDPAIKKVLQHGSYDSNELLEAGVNLQGYTFDTQYAGYLYNSGMRSYSLESMLKYWFLEFMDYKELVAEWMPNNLAEAPLDRLVTYNCADVHLTKRIELCTSPKISHALLGIYIQDAFVLDSMQGRGPILDRVAQQRLRIAIQGPPGKPELGMMNPIERQLQLIAEDEEFNPGSTQQVAWLIYDKLELPVPYNKKGDPTRTTKEEVLSTIAQQTGHPAPKLILQWRGLNTLLTTFLVGYEISANEHDGEVRTIWHLTGANTGRLRSGGGDDTELKGIINFQNLHGNAMLKNILVSDVNWRRAL